MSDLDEITAAYVTVIVRELHALPADEGRIAWWFWDLLLQYRAEIAAEERSRICQASEN